MEVRHDGLAEQRNENRRCRRMCLYYPDGFPHVSGCRWAHIGGLDCGVILHEVVTRKLPDVVILKEHRNSPQAAHIRTPTDASGMPAAAKVKRQVGRNIAEGIGAWRSDRRCSVFYVYNNCLQWQRAT